MKIIGKMGRSDMVLGELPYEPGCLGKTYIVDKGNSRIPAALKLGYTHIEGIIDEGNTFTL